MDTNESRLMIQLEKDVTELNKDVNRVKEQVGNVQREMGKISNNVKEILKILSGNDTVHGDHGITGRLFEVERRLRILEEWKDKHADFVVSDYKAMRKRVEVLEKKDERNRMKIAIWGGVATGLSILLQFLFKIL